MQAVFDNNVRPGNTMLFARRRDYMMRSEKRGGYNNGGSSAPNGRGKRPRRRKAGFFYILMSLLLSVVFWPVGMIMLWRRKVRWKMTTKLLASIITLVLCVTWIGFALTVQTDNPTVTKVQDTINDFLDHSVEYTAEGYAYICEKGVQVYESAADLGDAAGRVYMVSMADALDQASELAGQARVKIDEMIAGFGDDQTTEPEIELTPEPTDAESAPAVEADATEPAETATDAPVATDAPEATEPAVTAPSVTGDGTMPVGLPEITPDPETAEPIGNGTLTRDREFTSAEPTEAPTAEPTADTSEEEVTAASIDAPEAEATAEATASAASTDAPEATAAITAEPEVTSAPEATSVPVIDPDLMPKPAGEAVVYYNSNGVNYHMASSCKNMKSASAGTLADAVAKGLRRCRNCESPDASILEAENVVWVDEAGSFHLYADCTDFEGLWSLMTLPEALEAGNLPCAACQSGLYMAACGEAVPTPTPEPTPTPSPTPEPTPTPAPVTVVPSKALKAAGDAMVYHTSNGKWYHTIPDCSGMSGGKLFALSECYETHKRCRKCEAPLPELVGEHCLWQDETALCHTSDDCPAFTGKYTLVIRDEALAAGMNGCTVCYANEYLEPNTIIDYEAITGSAIEAEIVSAEETTEPSL